MRKFLSYGLSKDEESLFRRHFLPAERKQAVICMLTLMIPLLGFGISDFRLLGWSGAFFMLSGMRLGTLIVTAAAAVFLWRNQEWKRYDLLITVWSFITVAVVTVINYIRVAGFTERAVFDTVIIMITYLVIPNRLNLQTLIALLFSACETLLLSLKLDASSILPFCTAVAAFIVANVVGFAVSWQLNSSRRNDFSAHIEVQKASGELKRMAEIDDLTGVYNSRVFHALIGDEMSRFRRYGRPFAFIMMDMDHFKNVNDKYGHMMGDMVLKQVAGTVKGQLRLVDIVGRMGGEEFGIMLPETNVEDGTRAAERVRDALQRMSIRTDSGKRLNITASFGVTTVNGDDDSMAPVIARADKLLYQAKANGRNRVVTSLNGHG